MRIEVKHTCDDFKTFRSEKVKSLFNAESGHNWGILPSFQSRMKAGKSD